MKYEELRVPPEKSATDVIIPVDPDLEITEELLGAHAANSLVQHNSSARSYMYTSHLSQSLTLLNGDSPILETGVDSQLSEHTFGPVAEDDVRILKKVTRYRGMSNGYVSNVTDIIYFTLKETYDENTNQIEMELDIIDVPKYHAGVYQNFGFTYNHNHDVLDNLKQGSILKAGTWLARSPAVKKNGGYGLGVNANMLMCTHPDIAEDAVVISESLAKKMAYEVFETKYIDFGSTYLPLNLYGNADEYKPFPEIGDKINKNSVLAALRHFKDFGANRAGLEDDPVDYTPALLSNADLMEFDTNFDKCIYLRGPGSDVDVGDGRIEESGVVVDIKCFKNPKKTSELFHGMNELSEKYVRSYLQYCEDVINAYDSICKELGDRDYGYGDNKIKKSAQLHSLVVNAGKVAYEHNVKRIKSNPVLMALSKRLKFVKGTSTSNLPNKLGLSNRNENLDTYRMEFTIRYVVTLGKGHKISDQSGGKGVITDVRPDHLMPYNSYGRADIIMDSNSVINRMNLARVYQKEFCGASRKCQSVLRDMAQGERDVSKIPPNVIEDMFYYLMGLIGKFNTPQFDEYSKANYEEKLEILDECINEEVKIMHQVRTKKHAYQIVKDIENSEYAPYKEPVVIPVLEDDGKTIKNYVTKDSISIAPLYTILISKTADNMLFCSSPNLNNFAFPISVIASNRDRLPYRNSPTKIGSETEGRLYGFYGGRKFLAELKDRANSVPTHKAMYKKILESPLPTNIDVMIDRNETPYGQDSGIKLVQSILRPIGMEYRYIKGDY